MNLTAITAKQRGADGEPFRFLQFTSVTGGELAGPNDFHRGILIIN